MEAIYGLSAGFDQVVGLLRSIRTRAASLAGTSRTSIPSVRNRVVHGRKNDDADAVSVAIAERDCRVASAAFDGAITALRAIVEHRAPPREDADAGSGLSMALTAIQPMLRCNRFTTDRATTSAP